ncbi:MAG: VWA domain-containing protein [Proteobacteria bacterium]|nr:VWA domain-containing protein [Pseudomonadota bacterium]
MRKRTALVGGLLAIVGFVIAYNALVERRGGGQSPSVNQTSEPKGPTTTPGGLAFKPASLLYWPSSLEGAEVATGEYTERNLVVVLDDSGSMGSSCGDVVKMSAAKRALQSFVGSLPQTENLGLVALNDTDDQGSHVLVPIGHGAANRQDFLDAVDRIIANGNTPLGRAIEDAERMLEDRGRSQLGYGEYRLVVVTDGQASDGDRMKQVVDRLLTQTPVRIFTIGFCIDEGHALNRPGWTNYRTARTVQELIAGLAEAQAEADDYAPITSFPGKI